MGRGTAAGLLLFSHAACGCSGEGEHEVVPPPPASSCLPPNRLVGDRCLEPGVQDDGCTAGMLGFDDGSCQPAGVPPELCAEGFAHDGEAACVPILPTVPCAPGGMAIARERVCHRVMACGAGKWGDIPVEGTSVYVDASYAAGDSDGSLSKPWTSVSDAVAAAPAGTLIAVAAGSQVPPAEPVA